MVTKKEMKFLQIFDDETKIHTIRILKELSDTPKIARLQQGSIIINFPKIEKQVKYLISNKDVLDFYKKVLDEVPHIIYFFPVEIEFSQIIFCIASQIDPKLITFNNSNYQVKLTNFEIAELLINLLKPVVEYCNKIFDNYSLICDKIIDYYITDKITNNYIKVQLNK